MELGYQIASKSQYQTSLIQANYISFPCTKNPPYSNLLHSFEPLHVSGPQVTHAGALQLQSSHSSSSCLADDCRTFWSCSQLFLRGQDWIRENRARRSRLQHSGSNHGQLAWSIRIKCWCQRETKRLNGSVLPFSLDYYQRTNSVWHTVGPWLMHSAKCWCQWKSKRLNGSVPPFFEDYGSDILRCAVL